jgi:hypothetical protein
MPFISVKVPVFLSRREFMRRWAVQTCYYLARRLLYGRIVLPVYGAFLHNTRWGKLGLEGTPNLLHLIIRI